MIVTDCLIGPDQKHPSFSACQCYISGAGSQLPALAGGSSKRHPLGAMGGLDIF